MEMSIRMVFVVFILLVVVLVAIGLITNWGGQSNSAVNGLFKFFESLIGNKQALQPPTIPSP